MRPLRRYCLQIVIFTALAWFFADMLIKAVLVRADSFILPIFCLDLLLIWLIVRTCRSTLRYLRARKNTDFVRPRSFPQQRKRDIR